MTAAQTTLPASLARRWLGALRLDAGSFREIAGDPQTLAPAALLVLLGGLCRGVGAAPDEGLVGLVGSPLVALLLWSLGGALLLGLARPRGPAVGYRALLAAVGFSAAPLPLLALRPLAPEPIGAGLWLVAHVWTTLALVAAVRGALGVSLGRALSLCALALAVAFAVTVLALRAIEWSGLG